MLHCLRGTDSPFAEQIRFAAQLVVFIQNFQRTEQIIGTVGSKGVGVAAAVDQAILDGKIIIKAVQR